MKLWAIVVSLCLGLSGLALGQEAGQNDLPSAPSAVLLENKAKQAPPSSDTQPPVTTAPAPSTASQPAADPHAGNSVPPASASTSAEAPPRPKAAPQPKPAAKSDEDVDKSLPTIRKRVDEVNVIFTVTDKHNRFVKDLTKSDFRVLDDKLPQPAVTNFRAETDLPLRVGLLIDASNSVRDRFKFEQEAAIEFLNQIVRPRSDKAFVIGFDTTAEVTQDFTDSTEALSHGVRMLRPGGGTAMYDALYYACREKLAKAGPETGAVRRAIILLSDGEDNQSRVTREEAIEMAQRSETIVYAISTNVSGIKGHGDKVLERIADATGGRPFFPFRVEDVADAFSAIQDELRSQYALAYRPSDFKHDGKYHAIEILAQKHRDLHVRARRGYFAPTQ